jgi:hypothetical protein
MDVKGRKREAPITMDEDEEQKGQFLESDYLYPPTGVLPMPMRSVLGSGVG